MLGNGFREFLQGFEQGDIELNGQIRLDLAGRRQRVIVEAFIHDGDGVLAIEGADSHNNSYAITASEYWSERPSSVSAGNSSTCSGET